MCLNSNMAKIYGVFSQRQADQFGTVTWKDADGNEVEVTSISYLPDADDIHALDKVVVGEVVEHVRGVMPSRRKSRLIEVAA